MATDVPLAALPPRCDPRKGRGGAQLHKQMPARAPTTEAALAQVTPRSSKAERRNHHRGEARRTAPHEAHRRRAHEAPGWPSASHRRATETPRQH